jgi:hypothetical protein
VEVEMQVLRSQRAALRPLLIGVVVVGLSLAWLRGSSAESQPWEDGVAPGSVAFFGSETAACPEGWIEADYAMGRLAVGVIDEAAVGKVVGKPLGNQEDRTHAHAFTASVDLSYKAVAAADGANNEGAKAQAYEVMGTTDPAPTGLPFIQLLVCEKQ